MISFIYRAIESPPSLGLEESLCEGWLHRKSSASSADKSACQEKEKWKKRYFNLIRSPQDENKWLLAYFKDASMSKVLNAIQLSRVASVKLIDNTNHQDFAIEMSGDQTCHILRTSTSTEASCWVTVLEKARQKSQSKADSPNKNKSQASRTFREMKFFEDEMVDLEDIVELAPDCCPLLPPTDNGKTYTTLYLFI